MTIATIQQAVCAHFRIPLAAMQSPRRARGWARPRQIAMWLCKELVPAATLPAIGRRFARDHTTVIHACRVVPALIKRGYITRADIAAIEVALHPAAAPGSP